MSGSNVVSLVEEDLRQGQERNNTHNTTTIQKILWKQTLVMKLLFYLFFHPIVVHYALVLSIGPSFTPEEYTFN